MMEPDGKYGEELRRVLSAAADPLVPAGDGLSRIRARAARRPSVLAWLTSYATYLPGLLVAQLRIAGSWIAATAADPSPVTGKLRSVWAWPRRGLGVLREPSAWLRPTLAAGGALAIVLLAILLVPRLRYSVDVALSNNPSGNSQAVGGSQNSSAGQPNATGRHQTSPGHSLSSSAIVSSSSPPRCQGSSGIEPTPGSTAPIISYSPPGPGPTETASSEVWGVLPPGPQGGCSTSRPSPSSPSSPPTGVVSPSSPPTSPISYPTSSTPTVTPPLESPTPTDSPTSTPEGSVTPTDEGSASPG